jgi:hypothetical protein
MNPSTVAPGATQAAAAPRLIVSMSPLSRGGLPLISAGARRVASARRGLDRRAFHRDRRRRPAASALRWLGRASVRLQGAVLSAFARLGFSVGGVTLGDPRTHDTSLLIVPPNRSGLDPVPRPVLGRTCVSPSGPTVSPLALAQAPTVTSRSRGPSRKGDELDTALIQAVRKPDGWYVFTGDLIGPFYTRKSATDLGVGLVEALRDTGPCRELADGRRDRAVTTVARTRRKHPCCAGQPGRKIARG